VSWQSQKQRIVALSSCESEYVAATTAACQAIWLARLLGEIKEEATGTTVLNVDNKSAISQSKNPVFHERSKHIDIRYHFIRECVEDGKILMQFVRSEEQLSVKFLISVDAAGLAVSFDLVMGWHDTRISTDITGML
jgi:hypothetical protein